MLGVWRNKPNDESILTCNLFLVPCSLFPVPCSMHRCPAHSESCLTTSHLSESGIFLLTGPSPPFFFQDIIHTHTPFLTETVVQLKYKQSWKNSVIRVKVLRVTNFLLFSLLVQSINTETKSDEVLIPLSFLFYCKLKNVFFWRLFFF